MALSTKKFVQKHYWLHKMYKCNQSLHYCWGDNNRLCFCEKSREKSEVVSHTILKQSTKAD